MLDFKKPMLPVVPGPGTSRTDGCEAPVLPTVGKVASDWFGLLYIVYERQ